MRLARWIYRAAVACALVCVTAGQGAEGDSDPTPERETARVQFLRPASPDGTRIEAWVDAPALIYVAAGTQVRFRAVRDDHAGWPSGQPVWCGTALRGVAAAGPEQSLTFDAVSTDGLTGTTLGLGASVSVTIAVRGADRATLTFVDLPGTLDGTIDKVVRCDYRRWAPDADLDYVADWTQNSFTLSTTDANLFDATGDDSLHEVATVPYTSGRADVFDWRWVTGISAADGGPTPETPFPDEQVDQTGTAEDTLLDDPIAAGGLPPQAMAGPVPTDPISAIGAIASFGQFAIVATMPVTKQAGEVTNSKPSGSRAIGSTQTLVNAVIQTVAWCNPRPTYQLGWSGCHIETGIVASPDTAIIEGKQHRALTTAHIWANDGRDRDLSGNPLTRMSEANPWQLGGLRSVTASQASQRCTSIGAVHSLTHVAAFWYNHPRYKFTDQLGLRSNHTPGITSWRHPGAPEGNQLELFSYVRWQ